MDLMDYYRYSRKFLKEFEQSQSDMLHLHLEKALPRMIDELKWFLRKVKTVKEGVGEVDKKSNDFLLKMRMDLLIMHIHILFKLLERIEINTIDPFEIIRVFDKQHVFKKVLLAHLDDLKKRVQE